MRRSLIFATMGLGALAYEFLAGGTSVGLSFAFRSPVDAFLALVGGITIDGVLFYTLARKARDKLSGVNHGN